MATTEKKSPRRRVCVSSPPPRPPPVTSRLAHIQAAADKRFLHGASDAKDHVCRCRNLIFSNFSGTSVGRRACKFCPVSSSYFGVSSTNLTAANDKTILSTFILVLLLAAVQIVSDTLLMLLHTGAHAEIEGPLPPPTTTSQKKLWNGSHS